MRNKACCEGQSRDPPWAIAGHAADISHEDATRPALHPRRESSHWHVQEGISGLL